MDGHGIKQNILLKLFIVATVFILAFSSTASFAGVLSKEEKTQSEGISSKSAEKALIEQQRNNSEIEFNITWDIGNDAVWVNFKPEKKYVYGKGIAILPTKEQIRRPGYIFVGWKLNNLDVEKITSSQSGDIVLKAEWVLASVANDAASGLGQNTITQYAYNDTKALPSIKTPSVRETQVRENLVPQSTNVANNNFYGNVIEDKNSAVNSIPASKTTSNPRIEESISLKSPPQKILTQNQTAKSMYGASVGTSVNQNINTRNKTVYDAYIAPTSAYVDEKSASDNVRPKAVLVEGTQTYQSNNTSEPIAAGSQKTYFGGNVTAPETAARESAEEKLRKIREASRGDRVYYVFGDRDESEDDLAASDHSKVKGTQLGHATLHEELYEKKRVIAAGGGGGLGEGGGQKEVPDFGSGSSGMVITDSFANMPVEVNAVEVTNDEPGNDIVNETFGKAEDYGEFYKEDSGNHAGKKIFDLDRNGDIGLDEEAPISIKDWRWLWGLGGFLVFMVGAMWYIFGQGIVWTLNRRHEFF